MAEDSQINNVSVSGELTETGIKASIMSRAVSAWDRLWGAKADKKRAPIDADIAETSALSEARVKMIQALGELGVDRLRSDPEFATRAMENFLPSLLRRQENKDAVLELAVEDLRQNPGSEQESQAGPAELNDAFLNRFERYAEDATDEQIRERWAKVLASEVRKPGTFSSKVLRVVDELDPSTAQLFERVCGFRMGNVIPKALSSNLAFVEAARLVSAGLLVEPGLGQIRNSAELNDRNGVGLWFWVFGSLGIAATKSGDLRHEEGVIQINESKPAIPVYVLTDVGAAIASILPYNLADLTDQLSAKIASAMPESEIRRYILPAGTNEWLQFATIQPKQPTGSSDPS
ncbi:MULTISPECIES: DUF2806 domain-containing protein [unclassified Mesorhizobium]|uniref:DUF2806 domain-containing protein n=1 Tax=unclassified Mesorhizobium TaxID=325217 RepID=UPI000BAF57FC|nr:MULTISPECIES: DUF2806 domain-containing protein [unclassified Mesorhizobium]PBC22063.1 hypothetical protein CK226_15595 [Mesorhizobium sp. WSM4311]TRC89670.1 DUF2806 domain-containing protein [Mesorhizobium sp. WSM4305]